MDGITGFSPDLAKQDIQKFIEKYDEAANSLITVFKYCGEQLSLAWYSPHAVEFMNDYHEFRTLINKKLSDTKNTIVSLATKSYNILARVHDIPALDIESLTSLIINIEDLEKIVFKEMDNNGVVRMSTDYIRNILIPSLKSGVNKSADAFSNLPTNIAFYDPNGDLQTLFKKLIISLIDKIKEDADSVIDKVRKELETDVEMVANSVTEAVSVLDTKA